MSFSATTAYEILYKKRTVNELAIKSMKLQAQLAQEKMSFQLRMMSDLKKKCHLAEKLNKILDEQMTTFDQGRQDLYNTICQQIDDIDMLAMNDSKVKNMLSKMKKYQEEIKEKNKQMAHIESMIPARQEVVNVTAKVKRPDDTCR